jgi:hypothetical protein
MSWLASVFFFMKLSEMTHADAMASVAKHLGISPTAEPCDIMREVINRAPEVPQHCRATDMLARIGHSLVVYKDRDEGGELTGNFVRLFDDQAGQEMMVDGETMDMFCAWWAWYRPFFMPNAKVSQPHGGSALAQ